MMKRRRRMTSSWMSTWRTNSEEGYVQLAWLQLPQLGCV